MNLVDESSPEVVALLLDDLAPPRLGTLLRAARKQTGSTRREVAHRVGTSPSELRRYERGDAPVPPTLIAALAECYGEDLTAQLATRAPIQLDSHRLVVGTEAQALESDDADELLRHYVEIVSRLRQSQPGEPIALRADDLLALSNALGQDADYVEARIVDLLGCTPYEAHSLHSEMLRRKLVMPIAGLVAGIAMMSGAGMAQASAGAPAPDSTGQVATAHIAVAHIAAGHIAAGNDVTTVVAPAPTTVVVKPPITPTTAPAAPAAAAPSAEPPAPEAPADPETPEVPADPETPEAEAQATVAPPVVAPDDTPMGIPDNETVTSISP
jgi:transcriptional regulator with XRE-family HTH domain